MSIQRFCTPVAAYASSRPDFSYYHQRAAEANNRGTYAGGQIYMVLTRVRSSRLVKGGDRRRLWGGSWADSIKALGCDRAPYGGEPYCG